MRKYEKFNGASKPDSSLYVVEQENVGRKEMFTVSYCTKTNPEQNRDPWLFKVISTPAAILGHNDMIGVAKEKYNRLAAISESFNAISLTLHWINYNKNACDSKDCHRRGGSLRGKQMIHLLLLRASKK